MKSIELGRTLAPTLAAGLVLAPTLAACADGGEPAGARWAGTRDTIAGVEVVTNPEEPMLPAESRPTAREAWRAANTGDEGYWANPHRIAVTTNRVYVLDPQASYAYSIDAASGAGIGTIGGEGEGPGELERPFGIEVLGEWLGIGNSGGPRIDLFSPDGTYERSLRLNFLPFGMEGTADGRLMLTGLEQGSGITRLLDLDGTTTSYEPPDSSLIADGPNYGTCPRWGAGPEGLLRAFCRRLFFQQLSVAEGLEREVQVDRPQVLATEAELGETETQLRRMVAEANLPAARAERFVEERLEEARIKAVYAGIRGDPVTGRVYVLEQTPPVLGGGPASLNVFDPTGRYLARLAFDRPWVDFRVRGDRIFALTEDPGTGVRSVRAYDLDWPEPGAREP